MDAINTTQTKTPRAIPKQQAKSFLPSLDFLRPAKFNPATERRSPKPKTKRAGMRTNRANILRTSK
jgi:hypothetical protein